MEPTQVYVYLTCTAHGKPVWIVCPESKEPMLPDRNISNPPPVLKIGPYEIGPGGYESVEDAIASDHRFRGTLDDPSTWFLNPEWNALYAHYGIHPSELDIPVQLSCGCETVWHEADLLHLSGYAWCNKHGDVKLKLFFNRRNC